MRSRQPETSLADILQTNESLCILIEVFRLTGLHFLMLFLGLNQSRRSKRVTAHSMGLSTVSLQRVS